MKAKLGSDVRLYWRLLREARGFWRYIVVLLVLGFIVTPLGLLSPVPLKIAVDSVVGNSALPAFLIPIVPRSFVATDTRTLTFAVVLLVIVALARHLLSMGISCLSEYVGQKLTLTFRATVFRQIQRLSLTYHDAKGVSDSSYRIQYDARCLRGVTIDGFVPFTTSAVLLVGMLVVMFQLDATLAWVAMIISPVIGILYWYYRPVLRSRWSDAKERESYALAAINETLSAIRVVKAFAQEDRHNDNFLRRSNKSLWATVKAKAFDEAYVLLLSVTLALGTAAVLYLGIRHVQSGALTIGEFLIVMSYVGQLYDPVRKIASRVARLQSDLASADRIFTLLDQPQEVKERTHARAIIRAKGEIEFRDVCFNYADGTPVLRNVSFNVNAGERVAIIGKTGAGKTTLANLLTRLYDPTSGSILLDGIDLRDYKIADLRNQFGIVLQEPLLFSASIAENISYARPEASQREIVEAANMANAGGFIQSLPQEFDTEVGERGMRLSGGERQRISLARAFLKDCPILILDEPTSSVDARTEAGIFEIMERLAQNRTAFLITHRMTALKFCDLVLVLEDGRLREDKTVVAMDG